MGKKERHAAKLEGLAQAAKSAPGKPGRKQPPLLGFKAGWGWGLAAVGLFFRHPIYLGLGHALMAAGRDATLAASGNLRKLSLDVPSTKRDCQRNFPVVAVQF